MSKGRTALLVPVPSVLFQPLPAGLGQSAWMGGRFSAALTLVVEPQRETGN